VFNFGKRGLCCFHNGKLIVLTIFGHELLYFYIILYYFILLSIYSALSVEGGFWNKDFEILGGTKK
jgi:hypothetical protein